MTFTSFLRIDSLSKIMFSVEKILLCLIFIHTRYSSELAAQHVRQRILGGEHCTTETFPYVVAVVKENGDVHCGGSLVHLAWVLTAAHCIHPPAKYVVVGKGSPKEQKREIKESFVHSNYSQSVEDIALVKLDIPLEESEYVSFVKLPNDEFTGEMPEQCSTGVLFGWGYESDENTAGSSKMKCVKLPILNKASCAKYGGGYRDTMCTLSSNAEGGCYGDGGGPLVCKETGVQIGIFSSLTGTCGDAESPNIYVRVDIHLTFILQTIVFKSGYSKTCIINLNTILMSGLLYFVTNRYIIVIK